MVHKQLDVIICLHENNINNFKLTVKQLYKHLENIKIKVIANKKLENEIKKIDLRLLFIDEDKLVENMTLDKIKEILINLINKNKRAGWYFQQFLKMGYALSEECSEYYLIWDSDLILLKSLNFFEKGKMVIYKKTEYHRAYFETLENILGFGKLFEFSFIAEHMLIKKEIMQEVISKIEKNKKLKGKYYFEKILNSIKILDLNNSGFSEFETYGTYALKNYSNLFILKEINAWRSAGLILNNLEIEDDILKNLEKSKYNNFSLEISNKPYKFNFLLKNKIIVSIFGFFNIVILIKILNRIFLNRSKDAE